MWIKYNSDWIEFFNKELNKEYFKKIIDKVDKEYKINKLCPKKEDIFKVFDLCSLNNLKVIFLGQDPYHTPNVANGLAFSVNNELEYTPPSLKNIFKELYSDLKIRRVNTNLEDWVKQGVFLINTVLTVYENQPLSCSNWGWNSFILSFINYLNNSKSKYVYVLLGNNAKNY
ncbi:MAG: uracil-DNA glycosylase, partial [Ureaplasma sp.]|nr:uracil-DNA glycosylase [Ureaplasma sp.]